MGTTLADGQNLPRYSLIIPIFNEQEVLVQLYRRISELLDSLNASAEVIFVDDGSTDCSAVFLRGMCSTDPRVVLLELSRNFGHQIAITAGMDAARGEAVIVMDADLQDPPEVVHELIEKWKEGYEIVHAKRRSRSGDSVFKRTTADLYYRLLEYITAVDIPRDVGDFRLVGRKALEAFKQMPERDRFVRGMFGWMGFRRAEVVFDRHARAAGKTKYPLWKMIRLAVHGIVSFSEKPLRAALWFGLAISAVAGGFGTYALAAWFLDAGVVAGWTSIVLIVSLLSGINLLMTGIVGLYVGGIHAEVKRRPLYLVDRISGGSADGSVVAGSGIPASLLRATRTR